MLGYRRGDCRVARVRSLRACASSSSPECCGRPGDSALLCGVLARLAGDLTGRAVLDLCSGTGILGLTAARLGARVTEVDISRWAVACAWLNARPNRLATRHAARRVRGTRVPTGACSSTASASARRSTCSRVGGCCWCSRASPGRSRRGDGSPSTASSRRRSLSTWGAWARSPPSDWITCTSSALQTTRAASTWSFLRAARRDLSRRSRREPCRYPLPASGRVSASAPTPLPWVLVRPV
jgi:hypothetical protein